MYLLYIRIKAILTNIMILKSNGKVNIPRYVFTPFDIYVMWEYHSGYISKYIDDIEGRDNALYAIWYYTYRYFYH